MSRLTEALKEAQAEIGGKRGSGRTYRMLQHALATAKVGGVVYVVGADTPHVRVMMAQLAKMPEFTVLGPNAHIGLHTGDIQLPNPMGQIRFRSYQVPDWDWDRLHFKGVPQAIPVYIDHYAWERKQYEMLEEAKKAAKAAREAKK